MTHEEFKEFATKFCEEEQSLLTSKGVEYSGCDDDRLIAFKQFSQMTLLEPKDICQVFLLKHIQSINMFINHDVEGKTENIFERIHDARNYLLLLAALIHEERINEARKA